MDERFDAIAGQIHGLDTRLTRHETNHHGAMSHVKQGGSMAAVSVAVITALAGLLKAIQELGLPGWPPPW